MTRQEGGCHCGRVRFRAGVDLERLSHCSCSICTKKGILLLSTDLADFELLRGRSALKAYTFGTGVAQPPHQLGGLVRGDAAAHAQQQSMTWTSPPPLPSGNP